VSGRLPVDPGRLRREFPALSPEDLEAYVAVTTRILDASPAARAQVTREAVAGGRRARDKAARGEALDPAEAILARYLEAVEKMQRRSPRPPG
jgi:hypothetical protein